MKTSLPLLQEGTEFLKDFLREASHAKKRIWVETMFFESGKEMEGCEKVLIDAAKKKIDVRFTFDWITEKYFENTVRFFPSLHRKWPYWKTLHKKRIQLLQELKGAGVKTEITNTPNFLGKIISISGRNHNKMYLIDDIVWIGGVNLSKELEGKDIMVKFKQPEIVNALVDCFLNANRLREKYDYTVDCLNDYQLLFDTGEPGRSLIFDEALRMIYRAKKQVILVSQFVPDRHILKALDATAKRDVNVKFITGDNHFSQFTKFPENIFYLFLKQKIKNNALLQVYHYPGKVHAKVLLVDKCVLFGSHNYVWSGVFLGTSEVGMKSTDRQLVRQFEEFTEKLLRKAEVRN